MTITNDFVFIHFPKNAGSFVTKCIQDLYGKSISNARREMISYLLWDLFDKKEDKYSLKYLSKSYEYNGERIRTQHQGCDEIPRIHKHKPIVSIIRNPFDRYVSLYKYGWWKTRYKVPQDVLNDRFPHFPELTFKEYMNYLFNYSFPISKKNVQTDLDIGLYSLYYIKLYCKNYSEVLKTCIDINELDKDNFYDVTFLNTENVNQEFHDFLLKMNWPENKIKHILKQSKVNTSRPSNSYKEYYDQELIDLVMKKDALIFKHFPTFKFQ